MKQRFQVGDPVRVTIEDRQNWRASTQFVQSILAQTALVGRVSEVMSGSVAMLYRVKFANGADTVFKPYELTLLGVLDEMAAIDQLPERS